MPIRDFKVHDLDELMRSFEDELNTLGEVLAYNPAEPERLEIYNLLRAIREASLDVFNNLQKILVKQESLTEASLSRDLFLVIRSMTSSVSWGSMLF